MPPYGLGGRGGPRGHMPGWDDKKAEKRRIAFEFRGGAELHRIRDFVLHELESRGIVSVDKTLNDLGNGGQDYTAATGPEPCATFTLEWDVQEKKERGCAMSNETISDDIDHSQIAREGAITQRSTSRGMQLGDPTQWDDRVRVISSSQPPRKKNQSSNETKEDDKPEGVWKKQVYAPYDEWPANGTLAWWRMWLHFTMEKESYSTLALCIFSLVMLLILISTLSYCLETIPTIAHLPLWVILESVVSISFTVELFLRCISCRNAWKFWNCETFYFYNFLNLVDVVAIAPYYIEIAFGGGQEWIRVVRIIRLARIARAFGSESMREFFGILAGEFKKTWRQSVTMVAMLVVLETCVCASLIYVVESGEFWNGNEFAPDGCPKKAADQAECELTGLPPGSEHHAYSLESFCWYVEMDENSNCITRYIRGDGQPTPFISIPEAMYWVMSTMTTVGYGDIYPITVKGKIVGSITMLTGVLVVAVFIIVVGANFDETTKIVRRLNYKREMASKSEEEKKRWESISPRAEGVPKSRRRSASRDAVSAAPIQISQGPGGDENSENGSQGSQSGALLITPAPGSEKGRPISE